MSIVVFNEGSFRARVSKAIEKVRTILEVTRNPTYAADVSHEYVDKYVLAEFLTNTAIGAQLNVWESLGVTEAVMKQLREWAQKRTVSFRLKAEEKCKFLRKVVREVESDTSHVTKWNDGHTRKDTVVTKVTEYFWQFDVAWELQVFTGVGADDKDRVVLQKRAGSLELKTSSDSTPYPVSTVRPNIDVNITWALQQLGSGNAPSFTIDRAAKSCHTPRRNSQIDSALSWFYQFHGWCGSVHSYFTGTLFPVHQNHGIDLSAIKDSELFVPILPLFENAPAGGKKGEADPKLGSGVLQLALANDFLGEQKRTIEARFKELAKVFPADNKLITVVESKICVLALHARSVGAAHSEGVDYIEDMLRKQLIAAIGKEVTPVDFTNYLRFHNRKLFKAEYQPRPFSYAIRRPDHYPEGILSIEAQLDDGALADPIQTTVAWAPARQAMKFSLDAATNVSFLGDRYVHGWVSHQFSGYSGTHLNLVARARQFSSFIVLIGRIVSASQFEPKYAMIVKDKDDIKIPLNMETIPTPKEFRDAIESLSPEQQRFAKAYRSMQLESTLFGVAIIQIKPQLEKLLKLPDDSLTKEIQLTQDLLNLFIEYQIPSDLISYAGDEGASVASKVNTVKGYVKAMQEMIQRNKDTAIKEAAEKRVFRALESDISAPVALLPASFKQAVRVTTKSSGGGAGGPRKPQGEKKDEEEEGPDYTKIPVSLEQRFSDYDEDGALRPTVLSASNNWKKRYQKSLLSEPAETGMGVSEQDQERKRTFDLLDALTKSGVLSVDQAALHVIIAATHCFDKSIMNTIIQDNINPIEKVERSSLIVAATIHGVSAQDLVAVDQAERVTTYSPKVMTIEAAPERVPQPAGAPSLVAEKK